MKTESKADFSRRLELSKARVSQMVKDGLPCTEDGAVKVVEALAWVRRSVLPQNGSVDAQDGGDLGAAKLRLTLAQAEKAELDLEERRGSLVNVEIAKRVGAAFSRLLRDTTLNFPSRFGPGLAAKWGVDPRVVIADLDLELRSMLTDLSKEKIPFNDDES